MPIIHQLTSFTRYASGATESRTTAIALETEVGLSVNGEEWLSFRCSPEDLEGLAAGYLFNEGFIETAPEIASLEVCAQGDHVDAWLTHAVAKPASWSKTSGCQGGATQAGPVVVAKVVSDRRWPIATILAQVDGFLTLLNKPDFPQQGVHTTMLLDNTTVIAVSNDIGRHNTLDKIAGDCLLKPLSLSDPALITTGRISSEMVYKAARMKIPLVLSLHSVSQMAIQAAAAAGMTVVGHARRNQVDIYVGQERVLV